MTNVVGAQAIHCRWSKGKADSFCIGLLLLHLIYPQDNKNMVQIGFEVYLAISPLYYMTVNVTVLFQHVT